MSKPIRATPTNVTGAIDLRTLRLWHWRKALAARARAELLGADLARAIELGLPHRCRRKDAKLQTDAANFHIKCVQALNDCFPIGDTAENDDHA